jgi:hypothetical protein
MKQMVCPERSTDESKAKSSVKTTIRGVKNKMNVQWMTALRSKRFVQAVGRSVLAAFLAVTLAGAPVWAQDPGAPPQQPAPAQEKPGLPTPQTPAQDAYTPAPTNPPIPVSLGVE